MLIAPSQYLPEAFSHFFAFFRMTIRKWQNHRAIAIAAIACVVGIGETLALRSAATHVSSQQRQYSVDCSNFFPTVSVSILKHYKHLQTELLTYKLSLSKLREKATNLRSRFQSMFLISFLKQRYVSFGITLEAK